MEILLIGLVAIFVLAVLDAAAVEIGVDSRRESDDPHAPLIGAH